MNVSLTEELVRRRVESGRYRSAAEVIRAGLRLLEREEESGEARIVAMRRKVEEGIAQAERGEFIDGETNIARVKRRAAAKRRHPLLSGMAANSFQAAAGSPAGSTAGRRLPSPMRSRLGSRSRVNTVLTHMPPMMTAARPR